MPTTSVAAPSRAASVPAIVARGGRTVLLPTVIGLAGMLLTAAPGAVMAQDGAQDAEAAEQEPDYSRRGADGCLRCHDSEHVEAIFRTPHAEKDDPDTPFAGLQCETCHGPGGEHAKRVRGDEERPPIPVSFAGDTPEAVDEQNAVCLDCHDSDVSGGWHGGPHDQASTACADCHTSHAARDPVLVEDRQAEQCNDCHTRQRSQFQRAFSHPVRFGEMACSDCHAPHDSMTPALLTENTVNQTCYKCHAEKRGPFVWEHPPASEDCANCHRPHGSNHRDLLTKSPPLLCQDCHSRAGHPSISFTGQGLPDRRPSQFQLGGSCTNCHTRVHGSNHPSGTDLTR